MRQSGRCVCMCVCVGEGERGGGREGGRGNGSCVDSYMYIDHRLSF